MTLSERVLSAIFTSLVVLLSLIVLWASGGSSGPLLSEGLVTQRAPSSQQLSPQAGAEHSDGSRKSQAQDSVALETGTSKAHPLDPALQIAREALASFQSSVDDYTATMIKRERIGGVLGGETRMVVKLRTRKMDGEKIVRPLQVYLKMLDPWLARGREVIWIENKNDGKLVAHEGGLKNVIRVNLAPEDNLAMMGNKYPITEIGLGKLIEKLIEKGERDRQVGACKVSITDGFEVGGVACQKIEVVHPNIDPRFDFHMAQIFIDTQRMIPLRYAAWLWPAKPGDTPPLEEEYTYTDVRLNVGLTDGDFDPENSSYNFP